ncbi:HEAT repeat domain-containing protein [Verrucomicrobia bacterium]|nr:HEAT repeat domain-containing protein [Verrucomicrobiota bacterium]
MDYPSRTSMAIDPSYRPAKISVPDGFVVELVAGPPLVHHPMMAGFDDQGRLFVSETVGLNLKSKDLDEQKPNHVTMLEDIDGDGLFDKSTMFADKMTFPQGGLWHDGALYVCSPPGLWRLEDTTGNGRADKREQIATGFSYTGNAADVHGPFLHPSGRLYWCHGRKGHEVYQRDGTTLVSKNKGARIWSCQPDGSDVRVHAGGGMDNPTELVITPEGDILGTVNLFYGRPRGDVLVHWLYGGAYPRHDQAAVVAEFPRTGNLLKEVENFGHVAVSGLTRYQSGAFGEDYQNNLFITFFNTGEVKRTILSSKEATFSSRTEDFFKADGEGFHCTDVLEDADGSLLVIDTGGWFRIGCPTSQIAKPELYGGIYRIRRKNVDSTADHRGREIEWEKEPTSNLVSLLDDSRFVVRKRAGDELAGRNRSQTLVRLSRVMLSGSTLAKRNAIWILARIGDGRARALIRMHINDKSASVRQTICNALGLLRDSDSRPALMQLVRSDKPPVQRAAAAAISRIGKSKGVMELLQALSPVGIHRSLEHALIYALIQTDDKAGTSEGFARGNDPLKRRILIALNEMKSGGITSELVLPFLNSTNDDLRATAIEIAAQHKNWANDIAELVREWTMSGEISEGHATVVVGILPALIKEPSVRGVVGHMLRHRKTGILALEVISKSVGSGLDESWKPGLISAFSSEDPLVLNRVIEASVAMKSKKLDEPLEMISSDESQPALIRVKALSAMTGKAGKLGDSSFKLLVQQLASEMPAGIRGEAASMFAHARLSSTQLVELADCVARAGALELPLLMDAYYKSRDQQVGESFVEALGKSPGIGNVPPGEIQRMLTRYPSVVLAKAKPLLRRLLAERDQQAERLEALEASLELGDPKRGEVIFHSQKTLCAVCHRIGGKGGLVGPDLSRIGRIRTTRDLLESILYPSSSISRDFESYSIDTSDGETYSGVILRETDEEVQMATVSGLPVKLARNSIETIRPSSLSLMPQGLDQTMSKQELSDLVAYLKGRQ